MNRRLRTHTLACMLAGLFGTGAQAAELLVNVEIPRLDVAEYHRPYVAIWLESQDRQTVRDVAVWYEREKPKAEGQKWLKDLRQWWRISGRNQDAPADGVSGATRAAGKHTLRLEDTATALKDLPPGHYTIAVEAAREKGGRELLRLPLEWPPQRPGAAAETGSHELGAVSLATRP